VKGNPEVVAQLQALLGSELSAMDQYFIHSRMYEDWGYRKLHERTGHEMDEERDHADRLIRRMLFLEATPDLSKREPLNVGRDVPSMLRNDLDLEYRVVRDLRAAIAVCETQGDYQTREILETLLADTEEDHAWWLEQQLRLIDQVGLQNYLQAQV
jgi:bacterioferritin